MSTVVERVGQYAASLRFEDLDERVVQYAKNILLDSLACAYGGLESEPARIVRDTLQETADGRQATVFGKKIKLSAQSAALAPPTAADIVARTLALEKETHLRAFGELLGG